MLGRPKFVLASGSPRRLSLLNQAGIEPDALRPADVDETPKRGELPRACANRLARAKADAALKSVQLDDELRGSFILAADTVVAVGRRILPKAELVDEASQCLRLLSGRNHRVYTAICLVTPRETFRQRLVETRVRFKRLTEEDIQAYIGSGEWRGKAGGYAVQGIAGSFVVKLVGSYTNVVGLPLYETTALMGGEGFPIRLGWLNAGGLREIRAHREALSDLRQAIGRGVQAVLFGALPGRRPESLALGLLCHSGAGDRRRGRHGRAEIGRPSSARTGLEALESGRVLRGRSAWDRRAGKSAGGWTAPPGLTINRRSPRAAFGAAPR